MTRMRMALVLVGFWPAPQHVTEVIERSGDGLGNMLDWPNELAIDEEDNLYVVGSISDRLKRMRAGQSIVSVSAGTPMSTMSRA